MATTSKTWAMLHAKCPRCRRGAMFSGKVYGLTTNRININCPHCNLYFEIEPGYFYAAMYVSYALNVGSSFTLAMLTYFITGNTTSPWLYIGVIIGGCFLLAPLIFRASRVLLLYWLSPKIHYQPYLDVDDTATNT
jgi:uncharacterized protein (DUF983 family)